MNVKKRKDLLRRTMKNLEFIEAHVGQDSVFEITQLVNSFLATVLINWDDLESEWANLSQKGVTWENFEQSDGRSPRDSIGKIRDALAHGQFVFEENNQGIIQRIHLWTCPDRKTVDWHAVISVKQMRQVLEAFVTLAERRDPPLPSPKRRGDPCQ